MSQAKKEKKARENIQSKATHVVSNLCEGRRIIELKELGKNLKCCQCKQVLCLERILNEKRYGLHSILSVFCDKCNIQTLVATGKTHHVDNNRTIIIPYDAPSSTIFVYKVRVHGCHIFVSSS